jgi:hypothetical protein
MKQELPTTVKYLKSCVWLVCIAVIINSCSSINSLNTQWLNRGITLEQLKSVASAMKDDLFSRGVEKLIVFARGCRGCVDSHFRYTAVYFYDQGDAIGLQLQDGLFRETNDAFYHHNRKLKVKKLKDMSMNKSG